MDLINSQTEKERKMAINQISGNVTKLIESLRQKIIEILANIEVNIDYPEYEDIEELTIDILKPKLDEIKIEIEKIIKESKDGKIIKNGINTVIIGKPNVGKSSILNNLLEENKAIVTSIAGTTRDCVEGQVSIEGIILNIIDTAGIRETDDIVEKIGVNKSIELISKSDLVLYVLNNNEKLDNEDIILLEKIKNKPYIVIVNKIDLETKLDLNKLNLENIVYMNALNNKGTDDLKNKIKELFNLEKIDNNNFNYITNARELSKLNQALTSILEVYKGIENNVPIDLLEIDLKKAWELLGEIIGKTYSDELIDQLFSQFCLGK